MRHITDKDISSVVNMLIRKSVIMPEYGVQNKVVFSPVQFQRWVNYIIFQLFLLFDLIYGQHLIGRL